MADNLPSLKTVFGLLLLDYTSKNEAEVSLGRGSMKFMEDDLIE